MAKANIFSKMFLVGVNFFRNNTHSTILKREGSSANLSKIVNRMGNVLMQNIPKIMFLSEDNDKYLSTNKP